MRTVLRFVLPLLLVVASANSADAALTIDL